MTLGQRVAVLRDGLLQQFDTPQNLFHHPVNLFVAAFIGSPAMNLIDAQVSNGRISFADISFDLPESSPAARVEGPVILGVRPTEFEHSSTAKAELPRIRVKPDVVEDLGSELHVIFTLDAPRVTAEAVRAAADEGDGEGILFADDRAVFTAVIDARSASSSGPELELAIDVDRLHFFGPETGLSLAGAVAPSVS
jgi:multiple sugar transport system ATP-binding protein